MKPKRDKTQLIQPLWFEVLCKGEAIRRLNAQAEQICETGDERKAIYDKAPNDPEVQLIIFVEANCNLLFRKKAK